jgi:hypothetical protein
MAKKQTRRSISVSRTTYERLKAFCETNNISMSQLVETRVNDFLGPNDIAGMSGAIQMVGAAIAGASASTTMAGAASAGALNAGAVVTPSMPRPVAPRPVVPAAGAALSGVRPVESRPGAPQAQAATPPPMTSAAARFAVDPPPPIIKPRQDTAAPKPAEKRPDQIFTF